MADIIPFKKDREPLLPIRHPQADFFVCDILDAVVKDDMGSMEHPMFTLSTKPDLAIRHYQHGDVEIEVTPSVRGMANIFDKDILIYGISQLKAGMKRGEVPSRTLIFTGMDLLVSTNKRTDGDAYERLVESTKRLRGTTMSTTIVTGGKEKTSTFGLIERAEVVKKTKDGRMVAMSITLSEWLYDAVLSDEVLTLNRDYFRLRKPIERRIYEIARKHCGYQKEFRIGTALLLKKTGSSDTVRKLRMRLKEIEREQHLPDYTLEYDAEKDQAIFRPKPGYLTKDHDKPPPRFPYNLSTDTFEAAKKYTRSSGEDVYSWLEDWKVYWAENGRVILKSPDKAFLAWCAGRAQEKIKRPNGWD